jgi:hypothetical protein
MVAIDSKDNLHIADFSSGLVSISIKQIRILNSIYIYMSIFQMRVSTDGAVRVVSPSPLNKFAYVVLVTDPNDVLFFCVSSFHAVFLQSDSLIGLSPDGIINAAGSDRLAYAQPGYSGDGGLAFQVLTN